MRELCRMLGSMRNMADTRDSLASGSLPPAVSTVTATATTTTTTTTTASIVTPRVSVLAPAAASS